MRYRFVDCRWALDSPGRGRQLYLEGHIPGASFLDVDDDLSDLSVPSAGRHPLPSGERFSAAASRAGIDSEALVVAYGSGGGAERLWWLLRHFGHDAVGVLRGGMDAWSGPLERGERAVEASRFVAREPTDDTIDAHELSQRAGEPGLAIVDARVPERFRGEPNPIDRPPGRIPGAVNVPHTDGGSLPPVVLDSEEIVVYCGSGVTSCVVLHRLAEAGRPDAKLYPGSWSDWSARGLPLERD